MAVKAVEQLLGIRINYYAVVDFSAFIRFIKELGGVKIDVPARIRIDPIVGNPKILEPGIQTLGGELALAYARARNTAGGDLDRAVRQQQVIMGMLPRGLATAVMALLPFQQEAIAGTEMLPMYAFGVIVLTMRHTPFF